MISLSPRLAAAAAMIDGGGVLADIGTDHAYLPAHLIRAGAVKKAIAADIGALPLQNAKKTLVRYGISEAQVELRISDGLAAFSAGEAREICICGMGGTLIVDILAAAPWVKRAPMHLVLQPMTHAEDVRGWLMQSGFSLELERAVPDAGWLYSCMSARYTGAPPRSSPGEMYFGALLSGGENEKEYARRVWERICVREKALRAVRRNPEEAALLRQAIEYYEKETRQ